MCSRKLTPRNDYGLKFLTWDNFRFPSAPHLERIAEYSSICDRVTHNNALKELAERRSKKTKTV
ncbi:hypothetical protein [Photobacterium carnosum]|uniref:hypothetical protein n=1 Tax=Photobacterium carnosum TaxID=2023717 RepID=UPI001E378871|nr:hypothetical protein [Photobacterium carnosum]MCD9500374.1 hypothetical protein [Photobacterium carnosum]